LSEYFLIETSRHLTLWKKKEDTYFHLASLPEICERDRMLKSYLLYFLETNSLAKSEFINELRIFDVEEELGEIIKELIKLRVHFTSSTEITSFLRDIGFFSCMEKKDYSTLRKKLATYKAFLRIEGKRNERLPIL